MTRPEPVPPWKLDQMVELRDHIREAHAAQTRHRATDDNWIENEHAVIVAAANDWASRHRRQGARHVTVDEVREVEQLALGHIDYATKFAWYVAELAFGIR